MPETQKSRELQDIKVGVVVAAVLVAGLVAALLYGIFVGPKKYYETTEFTNNDTSISQIREIEKEKGAYVLAPEQNYGHEWSDEQKDKNLT